MILFCGFLFVFVSCTKNSSIEEADKLIQKGIQLYQQQKYSGALENLNIALSMYIAKFDSNHKSIAIIYYEIGNVQRLMEQYNIALAYYQKSLSVKLKSNRESDLIKANTYKNIGITYSVMKNYDGAIEYFEKAKKIYINIFGEEHPDTVSIIKSIEEAKKKIKNR